MSKTTTSESVDLLRADKNNARRMPKERLAGLQFAIEEYGDLSGIVWNEELGDLVAGHQRMKVLRQAGAKSWDRLGPTAGVIVHPKTGERFPIRIVRWPLDKHREAQLVANNPELQGEYSEEAVAQLRGLEDSANFSALRLDALQDDIDKAAKEVDDEHSGLEEFDNVPRPRPTWILVAAPEDVAAEIEGILRDKFGEAPGVRIEKSSNVL